MTDRDDSGAWSPVDGTFVFDERVARVFADMIDRSVPGYSMVVALTGLLAQRYAQRHSTIYDLGCSLGATTLAMLDALGERDLRFVAVDDSSAMVKRFLGTLDGRPGAERVEVVEADVREVAIENASVVALNFTLQFLPRGDRLTLLQKVWNGLRPGGVLVLSEKLRREASEAQRLHTAWHEDFKRANGYSELEIARKRSALENVLQADTEAEHRQRLAKAGFARVERWFQCFNFTSFLALK